MKSSVHRDPLIALRLKVMVLMLWFVDCFSGPWKWLIRFHNSKGWTENEDSGGRAPGWTPAACFLLRPESHQNAEESDLTLETARTSFNYCFQVAYQQTWVFSLAAVPPTPCWPRSGCGLTCRSRTAVEWCADVHVCHRPFLPGGGEASGFLAPTSYRRGLHSRLGSCHWFCQFYLWLF